MLAPDLNRTTTQIRIESTKEKCIVLRGGSSSSKTWSVCQMLAQWLVSGEFRGEQIEKGVASVVRRYSTDLDKSVMRDFLKILRKPLVDEDTEKESDQNLLNYIEWNKTKKTFTLGERIVEFIGMDNEQNARGGRREILFCNEANELKFNTFFQLDLRTNNITIIDFNPSDEQVWINRKIEQERKVLEKDVEVLVVTYQDNEFLREEIIKKIESYKKTDPMKWRVYGLGEYGKVEGVVFDYQTADVPEEAELLGYGLDFGFTNDPSALVGCYRCDGAIYLREIFYETGLINSEIAERILDYDDTAFVVADSAEPKSIEEISRYGIDIIPAEKGRDSINYGIDLMKQQPIYITPDSLNLILEFTNYRWRTDMGGQRLNKPEDKNNHGIDAVRYLLMEALTTEELDIIVF